MKEPLLRVSVLGSLAEVALGEVATNNVLKQATSIFVGKDLGEDWEELEALATINVFALVRTSIFVDKGTGLVLEATQG
jgi:hypothetical protein